MAPGGFPDVALKSHPRSRALDFRLRIHKGGHKVLLPECKDVTLRFLDVTMLAADMGEANIPKEHPDAGNFFPQQFSPWESFDLVICDGRVLRTYVRPPYRERREARRLAVSQLALGLEHVKPGGTMIMLLHRLELWYTVSLV